MTPEWLCEPASTFCVSVRDGTHDSPKQSDSGYHLVTSRHIVGGRLDLSSAYLISKHDYDAINARSKVDRWDVLLSMIGTVGEPCIVSDEPIFAIKNVGLFKSKGELEGKWLYYSLKSPAVQQLIREQSRGTTQQYIPLNALRNLPVRSPRDRAEMRAIVDLLAGFDDKIELNRKLNATLEAMARALFKSWFVDFDPVHAKSEGKKTTLAPEHEPLFSTNLVASELGLIPEGWSVTRLSEVLEESNARIGERPAPEYSSTNDGLQLRSERFSKSLSASSIKNKLIRGGFLVFGLSRKVLNFGLMRDEIGSVSAAYRVYKVNDRIISPDLLERFMRLNSNYFYRALSASSREGQSVSTDGLGLLKFVRPPQAVQDAFASTYKLLTSRIRALEVESDTLSSLRDALLSKLISGELRVSATRLPRRSA